MRDWARYWRAESAPVEAMHAHFTKHVYHRHSHESYSFGVTEAGAQAFTCRRGRHVSGPGLVMAFNPDDPHDGHAGDEDGFTYRMIHIWPWYFAGILDSLPTLPLFREPLIDDPALARALLRLHAALTGDAPELVRAERLIQAAAILDRHGSRGPRGGQARGSRAGGSRGVTREIAALVRQRIDDGGPAAPGADLTLADLAAAAGCSRYAAYRAFSAAYGMPPSDYQRQVRIRTARGLLAAGVPPAAAAAEAGFADQAHLTRWFRRYYGVTPGAYQAAALSGVDGEAGDHERNPGRRDEHGGADLTGRGLLQVDDPLLAGPTVPAARCRPAAGTLTSGWWGQGPAQMPGEEPDPAVGLEPGQFLVRTRVGVQCFPESVCAVVR